MAHCFSFFLLFHLSLTFFPPEFPFKGVLNLILKSGQLFLAIKL